MDYYEERKRNTQSSRYVRPEPRWYEKNPPAWAVAAVLAVTLLVVGV